MVAIATSTLLGYGVVDILRTIPFSLIAATISCSLSNFWRGSQESEIKESKTTKRCWGMLNGF